MFKKILMALLLVPSVSFATCDSKGCNGLIERLYIKESGEVLIGMSGDETKLNCSAVADVYLSLPYETNGYQSIYSALLAAQISNSKIFLRVNEGTERCSLAYVTIDK